MTKAERKIIQEQEARMWLDIQLYRYENAPKKNEPGADTWFETNPGYRNRSDRWHAVYSLMQELKIECDNDNEFAQLAVEYTVKCHREGIA